MISAKEAKKQSNNNYKSKLDEELEMIEQAILNASIKGKYCVKIFPSVSTKATNILLKLGYKVTNDFQYNKLYSEINWSK